MFVFTNNVKFLEGIDRLWHRLWQWFHKCILTGKLMKLCTLILQLLVCKKKKNPQNLKRLLKIKYYFYLIPPDFLQAIIVHSLFCNEVFNFEVIIDSLAALRTNTKRALTPSYPGVSTRASVWTEAG